MLLLHHRQLSVKLLKGGFGFELDLLLLRFLGRDLTEVAGNLHAALAKALLHFAELENLHLQTMQALGQCGDLMGQFLRPLRALGQRAIRAHRTLTRLVGQHLLGPQLAPQIINLLLPRQHAILLGVRGIKTHRQLAHQMPLTGHQTRTGW